MLYRAAAALAFSSLGPEGFCVGRARALPRPSGPKPSLFGRAAGFFEILGASPAGTQC